MQKIKPDSRPQLTEGEVQKLIKGFDVKDSKVILVGIRGYYMKTMGDPSKNDVGMYDDAFFLITPDSFQSFNGNTDPSRMHPGVAVLNPGLHWYKKGEHGITTHADGGYPAFRPATPDESVPVTRDGKPSRGIAINIHQGGWTTTSSEGCQTFYPEQWLAFQRFAYAQMDKYNQLLLPYILIG